MTQGEMEDIIIGILAVVSKIAVPTSSSAVAKRPRDASCLSVVSFNSTKRRVVFYC